MWWGDCHFSPPQTPLLGRLWWVSSPLRVCWAHLWTFSMNLNTRVRSFCTPVEPIFAPKTPLLVLASWADPKAWWMRLQMLSHCLSRKDLPVCCFPTWHMLGGIAMPKKWNAFRVNLNSLWVLKWPSPNPLCASEKRNHRDGGFEMAKSRISSVPRGEIHLSFFRNGQVYNPLCALEKWFQWSFWNGKFPIPRCA